MLPTGTALPKTASVELSDYANTTWSAGSISLFHSGRVGVAGGTFTAQTNAGALSILNPDSDTDVSVTVNSGATFVDNVSGGAGNTLRVNVPFNNQGTVNVLANSLNLFAGGTFGGQWNVSSGAALTMQAGPGIPSAANVLSGATISGLGTVQFTAPALQLVGNNTVTNLTLSDNDGVTGGGNLTLTGSSSWTAGSFGGNGTLTVAAGSSLLVSQANRIDLALSGGRQLVNNGTVTLDDGQTLAVDGGTNITNYGTFNVGNGSNNYSIFYTGIDPNMLGVGTFTNYGTLRKTAEPMSMTSKIDMRISNAAGSSLIEIDAGWLEFTLAFDQGNGTTYLNGGNFQVDGAGFTISGGVVKGYGTIKATLVTNAASIDETSLGSYNTLVIDGNYQQQASGSLRLKIGRTGGSLVYDRLTITGQATLGGTLAVVPVGDFTQQQMDDATILTFAGRNNTDFATISLPNGMTANPQATQYDIKGS